LTVTFECRGDFDSEEVNALHAVAFDHRPYGPGEWNWRTIVLEHSVGWATARTQSVLVGFEPARAGLIAVVDVH
jgi:hypothetical protein